MLARSKSRMMDLFMVWKRVLREYCYLRGQPSDIVCFAGVLSLSSELATLGMCNGTIYGIVARGMMRVGSGGSGIISMLDAIEFDTRERRKR